MKRKFIIGCIGIPFLILAGLLLFAQWVWGGSIKPSLDAQYVPTAEYLFEHPQSTPSFLSIQPSPSTYVKNQTPFHITLSLGDSRFGCKELCVDSDSHNAEDNYERWSNIFINNQRIPHLLIFASSAGNLGHYGLTFNFNPELSSGLHLFRIEIGSSFNDFLNPDPKLRYEWAYRVE
ncbi:MAG: hypothetical protein GC179_15545 [Anaerolineaceae bacterium]|nr:hypothetical protein [Anaerolineaceae bacterium]